MPALTNWVPWGGVRYVLEGSVQRAGKQIRVNAQLIDAETDTHLWAERFDSDTGDLFALQNDIVTRIATTLRVELFSAEAARSTEHPDALDYILRGHALAYGKRRSRDVYAERIEMFERALVLDPRSVRAQSVLAVALASRVLDQLSDSPATDIARAEELIGQALATSPRDPQPHWAKGQVLRAQGRCEEAIPEFGGGAIATPRTAPKRVTGWLAGSTLTSPVPGSGKPSRCSVHQAIGPVPQCNFSDRKIVARGPRRFTHKQVERRLLRFSNGF